LFSCKVVKEGMDAECKVWWEWIVVLWRRKLWLAGRLAGQGSDA